MGRIARGFRLLGDSWEVLKADRELLVLPVVSFICFAIVTATFGALIFAGGDYDIQTGHAGPLTYLLLFCFYFVSYFVGIYFNAALVGAAMIRLEGGDPTLSDAFRIATNKLGPIAAWAALAATVGLILRSLEERAGILLRIVISLIGAAWSAITFFVVPVILFEDQSTFGSVKRSAQIFKQRWGEEFTGNVGLSLAMIVVLIPVGLVVWLLASVSIVGAIVVAVIGFGIVSAAFSAMSAIFTAALYRYAAKGETSWAFTEQDLAGAFAPRRRALG